MRFFGRKRRDKFRTTLPGPKIIKIDRLQVMRHSRKYDFLKYDQSHARYVLGLTLFDLGGVVLFSFTPREAIPSHLTHIHNKTTDFYEFRKSVDIGS